MKFNHIFTLGIITASLCVSQANAATITWDNDYRWGSGGEFTLVDTGLDLSGYADGVTKNVVGSGLAGTDFSFQTFCIEYNEHISKGQTVNVSLESGAINGGAGGNKNAHAGGGMIDPISKGTALLYSQFAQGTLSGYDYNIAGSRQSSAFDLQKMIWYLEGEISSLGTNMFTGLLVSAFGAGWDSYSSAKMDYTGGEYGSVLAANLTKTNGYARQDQLYYNPSEDFDRVPDEGLTLLLMGLGLSSLWAFKKRSSAA